MIRKWASKLRRSVSRRTTSRRRQMRLPITVSFGPDRNTGSLHNTLSELSIRGETQDLSTSGIGFIVSSIRLHQYYLVGEGRVLNAELNLPNGKIKLQMVGQRYQQVGEPISASQYLIGAKITEMSESDKEIYNEYLLNRKPKAGSLEFGIDEG